MLGADVIKVPANGKAHVLFEKACQVNATNITVGGNFNQADIGLIMFIYELGNFMESTKGITCLAAKVSLAS